MITKIKKIVGLGIFQDYQPSADLPDFKRYNLFYGWNGSGKSTLAKLFRHLENREVLEHIDQLSYKIDMGGHEIDHKSMPVPSTIKVFNSTFIKQHTDFEKGTAASILYIGKEKVDLKNNINAKKQKLKTETEKHLNCVNELKSLEKRLDDFFISAGAELRELHSTTIFSKDNITKSNAYQIWNGIKEKGQSLDDFILSSERLRVETMFIQQQGLEKVKHPPIVIDLTQKQLEDAYNKYSTLLETNPVNQTIARLEVNPEIQHWVERGLLLHEKHSSLKCEFCNNEISASRKAELSEHFNQEFKSLQNEIRNAIEEISELVISLPVYDTDKIFEEFKPHFNDYYKEVEDQVKMVNFGLDEWQQILKIKLQNPLLSGFAKSNIIIGAIPSSLLFLNSVISQHNDAIDNFTLKANEYKSAIDYHVIANKAKNNGLIALLDQVENKKADRIKSKESLEQLEDVINIMQLELADDGLVIAKINEDLHKFLGRDEIYLIKNEKGGYILERNKTPATNLSEGEKSAISLVYFINKLGENENKVSETILVFDDPISSFDSNHLFSACSFIMNNCSGAKQLFILTHNFWFFKLNRDWLKKRMKEQYAFFTVKKGNIYKAEAALVNHHSEYHFVFKTILDWTKSNAITFTDNFSIANLCRRLLESFNAFKTPSKDGFNDILMIAQKNGLPKDTSDKLFFFLNKYSHLDRIENHENVIENIEGEGLQIAKDTLKIIELIDSDHYSSMLTLCEKE
jgi:wobble nucleotide-excising tRNase